MAAVAPSATALNSSRAGVALRASSARPSVARAARLQCRATAVPTEKSTLPPPPFQAPTNGNGNGNGKAQQQPGWPSLDETAPKGGGKKRIVVLGTGWASMSFVKAFDESMKDKYELVLLSPRNYFVYTPLLPAMCAGTVEERSIVEPVRAVLGSKGKFFEAKCTDIMPEEKTIVACFPEDAGFPEACFKIPYDYLVLGVGSINNTFNIQGVQEHTMFFKTVEDAARLRLRISECFERAALPQTTPEERKKLLSFVIVGGGPTGVEVAAELHDLITEDLVKLYPDQIQDVSVRVIELMDHVLSMYDRAIGQYTAERFARSGINLVLNSRVKAVQDGTVTVVDKEGNESEIPFGACVWATGVAMHPVVRILQEKLPAGTQNHFRSAVTDEHLRVRGSNGTIFALGDAATIEQAKAVEKATQLFDKYAQTHPDGRLTLPELQQLMAEASQEFPHLREHATFLDGKLGMQRFGGLAFKAFQEANKDKAAIYREVGVVDPTSTLNHDQFVSLINGIDAGLRALPATAQVARQQGEFLAEAFRLADGRLDCLDELAPPFQYFHKGSMAYVGGDRAVMDVPKVGPLMGITAGLVWRGFETWSQISFRNQILVANDWARTKIFGRDTSRV
ncbi:type-II calcium-dependent NADH dehydrogenase isoform A [Chlorella sorokiniana]|uniref:NADH:ubiquinone reductase (non-electrogenic) n=1 Tax=Chlorella sorokiniana TaxID=3076 RepID=A0A2P6TZC2_CHLSO|nr:type-II calcium-dependent NADH dehydrogenase isoform A [Chlorella sorokiniana]|eukprot:PRW59414.1 type-II calcium-dependent NADH dehydrogenase isoform A [Chlorella sorokiniana]